jgi:ABC-type Na+ efflux pump permease subunit
MRNKILTFAITGVVAMVGMSATAQESKKTADARKEVASAKKDLKEAKIDSAVDFQKFKKEAEIKIRENQEKIAELKAKKSNDSREIKAKYDKKVLALEKKNNELKNKIKKADDTKTTMWTSFKREFNHDMDELGHAFKDIGVSNTK